MKIYRGLFLLLFFATFAMSSCVQNNVDTPDDTKISDVVIPADFNWSTITTARLTVVPADFFNAQYFYVIEVFGENPVLNSAAPLLSKGVVKGDNNFNVNLILPTSTREIFVRQTNPVKGTLVQSVAVSGENLLCDFNSSSTEPALSMPDKVAVRSVDTEVDPTPASVIKLSASSAAVSWTNNVNYLIPAGVTYTKKIDLGTNSTLYIEGTYKLEDKKYTFAIASGGKLVIQEGGKMIVGGDVDLSFHIGQIKNFGSLTADGKFDLTSKSTMYNAGILNFVDFSSMNADNEIVNDGEFNAENISVQSNAYTNNGTFKVSGTFEVTSTSSFVNNGSVTVEKLATKSGSKIYNNCHITVTDLLDQHGSIYYGSKGSLIEAKSLVSDGTSYMLSEGSIMDVEEAEFSTWRNYINGVGTDYALARLGSVDSYKNAVSKNITYQGKLEVSCSNHLDNEKNNPFWVVEGDAVRWSKSGSSTTVIASTGCNDGGNVGIPSSGGSGSGSGSGGETPPPPPPADPAFPIVVNLTTNYSFIMEDNWPLLGDYDLNDLVVDVSISYLQNADNKATQMKVGYKLRAVGAMKRIAAAFQLDNIQPNQVSSVSYITPVLNGGVFVTEKGGLETGQSKAVIPMFDDAHSFLNPSASGLVNTIIGGAYFAPQSDTVTINFETPVDPSTISIAKINFFIVTNGLASEAKRTEIHLSGFEPTDKMDNTLFGTADDASDATGKYRTANNLIWGLLIPTSFNYAAEWKDITGVYPQFAGWCTSGGVENTFWYEYPTDKAGYVYIVK